MTIDDALERLRSAIGAPLMPPIDPSDVTAWHIAEVRADIEASGMGDVGLEIACGAAELDLGREVPDQQQRRAREVVAAAWNARHATVDPLLPTTLGADHISAMREVALARGDRGLLAACEAAGRGDGAARWIVIGAWHRER